MKLLSSNLQILSSKQGTLHWCKGGGGGSRKYMTMSTSKNTENNAARGTPNAYPAKNWRNTVTLLKSKKENHEIFIFDNVLMYLNVLNLRVYGTRANASKIQNNKTVTLRACFTQQDCVNGSCTVCSLEIIIATTLPNCTQSQTDKPHR